MDKATLGFHIHIQNMANFEAFCWNISSSINLLCLKSAEGALKVQFMPLFPRSCTICFLKGFIIAIIWWVVWIFRRHLLCTITKEQWTLCHDVLACKHYWPPEAEMIMACRPKMKNTTGYYSISSSYSWNTI